MTTTEYYRDSENQTLKFEKQINRNNFSFLIMNDYGRVLDFVIYKRAELDLLTKIEEPAWLNADEAEDDDVYSKEVMDQILHLL
jgi:hypothetical protein